LAGNLLLARGKFNIYASSGSKRERSHEGRKIRDRGEAKERGPSLQNDPLDDFGKLSAIIVEAAWASVFHFINIEPPSLLRRAKL
jgi:hypothetical protein